MKATRGSQIGDKVTVTNPETGKDVTGTVDWISPTKGTLQIRLDGGRGYAYEYPEDDGTRTVTVRHTYIPSDAAIKAAKKGTGAAPKVGDKIGLKSMVATAMTTEAPPAYTDGDDFVTDGDPMDDFSDAPDFPADFVAPEGADV